MKKINCSKFKKGEHPSPSTEFKKGCSKSENWYKVMHSKAPWNKGLTKDDPRVKKNVDVLLKYVKKGVRNSPATEFKKGLIPWNKGMKGFQSGNKHPNWKGGITSLNKSIRNSPEYEQWRQEVFQRDNFTCQKCGHRGGELQADHIKPFFCFSELRLDINNGRTLCKKCHRLLGWSLFKQANPRKGGTLQFAYQPRYL
jgi:hypothetical protein